MVNVVRKAAFSRCGRYRYALWREWDPSKPRVLFIGLNPATADACKDDNTMRRCMHYARSWGFGSMAVGNLFAWRTTWPRELKKATDPVGRYNDRWLRRLSRQSALIVAMWGNHGSYLGRAAAIRKRYAGLHCLGVTSLGEPHHTRGLPNGLMPSAYTPE